MNSNRYNRQIVLKDFGIEAQQKLFNAKIIVIGAGGLGSPVLTQLTAAGVGNITIVDFDTVDISNLQRQMIYDESSIGKPKVEEAKRKLSELNSSVFIHAINAMIDTSNVFEILTGYDLVLDCSDNFQTRYLVNDACRILKTTLIYGSVFQYEGQVAVFNFPFDGKLSNQYRDLFPHPPKPNEVPNCNEAGVLGTLTSIIGSLQATETIKCITGIGDLLYNKLLSFNVLNHQIEIFEYSENVNKGEFPKDRDDLIKFNYPLFCHHAENSHFNLDDELNFEYDAIVDIRENFELPKIDNFQHIQIPIHELDQRKGELERYNRIIFVCQSGNRSSIALKWAEKEFPKKEIYHIRNGVFDLLNYIP